MINKKAIIRICLIYFCVLLPLLGTNVFVVKNFLNKVQVEEEAKLFGQLYEIADMLSTDFAEYKNKGVILFENKKFSSNLRLKNPMEVNEAFRSLNELQIFDEGGAEILVYYGEQRLYTSNGDVKLNVYFERTLGCTKQSVENAIAAIKLPKYSVVALNGTNGLEFIMVHVPVGEDIYGYARSMEILIKASRLEKIFASVFASDELLLELGIGDEKAYFYYVEPSCRILTEDAAKEMLTKYNNEPLEHACKDEDINIRFWYDIKNQLEEFYQLRNINLFLFAMGLLLSVAVSIVLSISRFSRLKEIIESISHKKVVNQEKQHWKKNEFDYIQMAVNETVKENNAVRIKEKQYRKTLLNQVAKLIFFGEVKERKEIQAVLRVCGVELYEEYFFALGICVKNSEEIRKLDELLQADIYFTNNEKFVFVFSELPFADFDMKKRYEIAKNLKDVFAAEGISCSHIAMSKVYTSLSMGDYAYLEVVTMLKRGLGKKQKTECWEEWIRHKEHSQIWFDNTHIRHFREAVEKKNEQEAMEILQQVLQQEEEYEKIRNICYMFQQALLIAIDVDLEEDTLELTYEINTVDINDACSFVKSISQILSKYCKHSDNTDDFEKVIQFVNENYTSYEISLNMVSEYAGLSKSKTSRLFKECTGEAYIDYVTRLRMEKIKKLLEETDMSVKDILQQVGYLDITNASKKFKAYFQMNPSAYRTQVRKEKGENESGI